MIKIEFTDAAKEFLRKKKVDSITVEMMSFYYGGQYNEPVVPIGKPNAPQNYDLVDVNGIKVYIFKGAEAEPGGIRFFIEEGDQKLQVAGLIYEIIG